MSLTFTVPGEVGASTYRGRGVRLQAQRPVTAAIRRDIVRRYLAQRTSVPHVAAFAERESRRLAELGYFYKAGSIATLICRNLRTPRHAYLWERMLQVFRQKNPRTRDFWYDVGDLSTALGWRPTRQYCVLIGRLQRRGHEIRKCRTAPDQQRERGWEWQYRLWEAVT